MFDLFVIFGNFLVIYVVFRFRRLRNVPGLMIASLASTDLSLGLFVLPFSTTNQLLEVWIFDEIWCQMWLLIDVLLCTASIYHLVAISCDRCIAVTQPLAYSQIMTKKRGRIVCACVWLLALFISVLPLLSLFDNTSNNFDSTSDNLTLIDDENCFCTPMNNSPTYIVLSAISSFYVPLLIIGGFYLKIYLVLRDVRKQQQSGTLTPCLGQNNSMESPRVHVGRYAYPSPNLSDSRYSLENGKVTCSLSSKTTLNSLPLPTDANHKVVRKSCSLVARGSQKSKILMAIGSIRINRQDTVRRRKQMVKNLSRDIRAAKTVAIVVGCFIFCWIGFAICYLMEAFPSCNGEHKCVPDLIFSIVFWLGYCNSGNMIPFWSPFCFWAKTYYVWFDFRASSNTWTKTSHMLSLTLTFKAARSQLHYNIKFYNYLVIVS